MDPVLIQDLQHSGQQLATILEHNIKALITHSPNQRDLIDSLSKAIGYFHQADRHLAIALSIALADNPTPKS